MEILIHVLSENFNYCCKLIILRSVVLRFVVGFSLLLLVFNVFAQPELKGSPQELQRFLQPKVKTISISESAEEIAFKDEAIISMLVTTEDDKLAVSLSKNAKIRSDISVVLIDNDIPLKNIKSANFSTSPDYGWFGDKPDNYKVTNTVTIRINNEAGLQSVARMVDKYDEVTLLSTVYEHSKKEAYQKKVKEKALKKVLDQKEFYTKNLGIKLEVVSFNDFDTYINNEVERIEVTGSRIKRGSKSHKKNRIEIPTSFEKIIYSASVTVDFTVQ